MRNIVKLALTTCLLTIFSVASASEHKLDTQFSIYEILNNYYSFDICVPKQEGVSTSVTVVYWDGTKNIFSVHPTSNEFNDAWLHSNVMYQIHDKSNKITVSVDFNLDNGDRIKTETYTISTVTKDLKSRGLIIPSGQKYIGCSTPNNSAYGDVYFFNAN